MFKNISKLSTSYNEAENNRKFTNALHTNNKVGIASFIYMCRQHGIDTNRFYIKDGVDYAQPVVTNINTRQKVVTYAVVQSEYVDRSLDKNLRSDFVSYLKTLVADVDRIVDLVNTYKLGLQSLCARHALWRDGRQAARTIAQRYSRLPLPLSLCYAYLWELEKAIGHDCPVRQDSEN